MTHHLTLYFVCQTTTLIMLKNMTWQTKEKPYYTPTKCKVMFNEITYFICVFGWQWFICGIFYELLSCVSYICFNFSIETQSLPLKKNVIGHNMTE